MVFYLVSVFTFLLETVQTPEFLLQFFMDFMEFKINQAVNKFKTPKGLIQGVWKNGDRNNNDFHTDVHWP